MLRTTRVCGETLGLSLPLLDGPQIHCAGCQASAELLCPFLGGTSSPLLPLLFTVSKSRPITMKIAASLTIATAINGAAAFVAPQANKAVTKLAMSDYNVNTSVRDNIDP